MSQNLVNKIRNCTVIDARSFSLQNIMIKNSIWFGLQGIVGGWVNYLNHNDPYIINDNINNPKIAEAKLKEYGFKNIIGSFNQIQTNEIEKYKIQYVHPDIFKQKNKNILDVRRPDEWKLGVIKRQLLKDISFLPKQEEEYLIHCKIGYRAIVAYTWLKKHEYNCKVFLGNIETLKQNNIQFQ